MRKLALTAIACVLALGVAVPAWAAEPTYTGNYNGGKWDHLLPDVNYVEGEFLLRFKPGVDKSSAEQAVLAIGWNVSGAYLPGDGTVTVAGVFPKGMDIYEAEAQAYTELPIFRVELNGIFKIPELPRWERLGGPDALWTMALISRGPAGFRETGGTVVLAGSSGYWDALSASALAGAEGAPVLLTDPSELSSLARAELARLRPTRVIVAGGEQAVSARVEGQVRACLDAEVVRVAGDDAQGTARAFCERLGAQGGEAFVASSTSYHDALSIAPYAYAKGAPVLLTGPDGRLSSETLALIEDAGFEKVVVVGGPASVSPDVEAQLGARFSERVYGEGAVDTSAATVAWERARGMGVAPMGVASADGWHDALAGAALCGRNESVLVLASPDRMQAVESVLSDAGSKASGFIFGGFESVPKSVADRLMS